MQKTNYIEPEKITAGHAWRRWAARKFDEYMVTEILLVITYLFGKYVTGYDLFDYYDSRLDEGEDVLSPIIFYIMWDFVVLFLSAVCNAMLISCFGNTLGKQLCGIQILHTTDCSINFKKAFKREMLVLLKGRAIGIPIVDLYTAYRGYKNLRKNKITIWDKQMYLKVNYRIQSAWVTLAQVCMVINLRSAVGKIFYKI